MENAILLHNAHWQNKSFNVPIKRTLLDKLLKFHQTKEIQVITGLRRSGKSSLLKLYINEIIKTENPKSVLFINFDDPNYSDVYKDAGKIYKIVEIAEKLTQTNIDYLFLDEIQSVEGWEKFIKSVYDADRFKKICITGSNSKLLQSDYSGLLSGRYIEYRMYPLSLNELLNYYGFGDKLAVLQNKSKVLGIVEECLKYGTFPEVVLKDDWSIMHEILTNYYDSILIKDCIINKNIRDHKSFRELAFYIFNNLTSLFSYNSISRATGINDISVKEYIYAMQEAFMIYEISQFSYKIKMQLRSKKKLYAIDNGLITAVSLNFSENRGELFENFVFAELLKSGYDNIYLFNEKKECDFIIKKGNELIAIQATYEINTKNRDREITGLLNAVKKVNISKQIIVTMSQSESLDNGISIVPIYELNEMISGL